MVKRIAAIVKLGLDCGWTDEAIARSVLTEMREPTEMMFMHGGNAEPYNRAKNGRMRGHRIGDLPARDTWRIMIDAALADEA